LDRAGTAAAFATGLAAVGMAAYHLLTPGSPAATFGSPEDWLRDLLFLGYLVASVAAVAAARRSSLASRAAALLVGAGYGLIAVGVVAGLVLQEDPDWFFVLGGPGLLLSAAGFVTWAVAAGRGRRLPWWAALWCGVGGLVAVFGAELGTSLLIGLFWLWLGATGRDGRTE
ncbi:MAG TPA: hypothetical protein VD859_12760, partial [Nocardioides sp.]|nr:hypothetical protein [Nocardioides sp.]